MQPLESQTFISASGRFKLRLLGLQKPHREDEPVSAVMISPAEEEKTPKFLISLET